MKHTLITGGAGFVGSHLADELLCDGWRVAIVDNFDPFYARAIKEQNVVAHLKDSRYTFIEQDIRDHQGVMNRLNGEYDCIVHLAAKAGVRPSIEDPGVYQQVNVGGTQNMLEFARRREVKQFVFASSSSVYGINPNVPWREDDMVLLPISPYAATKVAGELLGHVYSHLFGIRFLALRFFTVYGPRQRPDLAIHRFVRLMSDGDAIPVFGDGSTRRDYTYVGDVVQGIRRAMEYDRSRYEVINLGNSRPVVLLELIRMLEDALGTKAKLEFHPEQPGDVPQTFADTSKAERLLGYDPVTSMEEGIHRFVEWHFASAHLRSLLPDHKAIDGY